MSLRYAIGKGIHHIHLKFAYRKYELEEPTNYDRSQSSDQLSHSRYVAIVVRVTLDQQGQIVHGEVIEVNNSDRKQFVNWVQLMNALHDLVSGAGERTDNGSPFTH